MVVRGKEDEERVPIGIGLVLFQKFRYFRRREISHAGPVYRIR